MGERDLFLGSHGEGATEHWGTGIIMVPMLSRPVVLS
jgi:hypothetical protein